MLSNFAVEMVRKTLESKDIASTINRDERTVKKQNKRSNTTSLF